MASKDKPKVFTRKGETAFAHSPGDAVRLAYNGWTEVKTADPDATDADATADENTTSTKAGKAAPKKAG